MWPNITLTQGAKFTIHEATCNSALTTVINKCPIVSIGGQSMIYGGGIPVSDGLGATTDFKVNLVPNP